MQLLGSMKIPLKDENGFVYAVRHVISVEFESEKEILDFSETRRINFDQAHDSLLPPEKPFLTE